VQLTAVYRFIRVFELLVTLDACQSKNIIGIICIDIFQVAMLIYSAVLPRQLSNALDGSNADEPRVRHLVRIYSIVIPGVIGACSLAFFYLTWKLYEEFGWDVGFAPCSSSLLHVRTLAY